MEKLNKDAAELVLESVRQFWGFYGIKPGKYLVAVSGGIDSMVLLHALGILQDELQITLGVFHLNHLYRADAADRDACLVADVAKEMSLKYFGYRRPVEQLASYYQVGFEDMGRKLRYNLMQTLCRVEGYTGLITAHHADDQAETILMHLFRGAGLKGLTGIAPYQGNRLRPFLSIEKSTLYRASHFWGITCFEDDSNLDVAFKRNAVRHLLLPQIKSLFGDGTAQQLFEMAQILRDDCDFIDSQVHCFLEKALDPSEKVHFLDADLFDTAHIAIQRRVIMWIFEGLLGHRKNLNKVTIEGLRDWMAKSEVGGKTHYLGLHFERRRRGFRIMTLKHYQDMCQTYKVPLKLGVHQVTKWGIECIVTREPLLDRGGVLESSKDTIYLEESLLEKGIYLRNRVEGDSIAIPGMQGKRKALKKLYSEWDLASDEKYAQPLVATDSEILWVAGRQKSADLLQPWGQGKALIKIKVTLKG